MQHLYESQYHPIKDMFCCSYVKGWYGFACCIELNHMLHRLFRPPSIPLSFGLAAVLPRWSVSRVSWATSPRRQGQTLIVYGMDYQGI
jgi:hypothetical protein